jgi:hypothetical protein
LDLRETAQLLAVASSIDNRIVDQMTVGAWQEAVGHLSYTDCREALAMHRRESTEYLVPAHIVAGVKRLLAARDREERVARRAIEPNRITLDRAEFERLTREAIEQARRDRLSHG